MPGMGDRKGERPLMGNALLWINACLIFAAVFCGGAFAANLYYLAQGAGVWNAIAAGVSLVCIFVNILNLWLVNRL